MGVSVTGAGTNGLVLSSGAPSGSGSWCIRGWFRARSYPNLLWFAFNKTGGGDQYLGIDNENGGTNTKVTGYVYDSAGNVGDDADIATGSDTHWYYAGIKHVAGTATYTLFWRKEGDAALTTDAMSPAVELTAVNVLSIFTDGFGSGGEVEGCSFTVTTTAPSDATLLSESQSLSSPGGSPHTFLRMSTGATAGTNTGTAGNYTVLGTVGTSATEPNPAISGGGNTPVGVNATQTQTASRTRAIGRPRSANQAQSPSATKARARNGSATQTQTATVSRAIGRRASATQTQSTSSGPMVQAGLLMSANQTQAPSRSRALGLARAANETQTPTATRSRALARALAATQTQTSSRSKAQTKALLATHTQAPSRAAARALNRSATSTQTPTRALAFGLLRTVTATQSPSVRRALAITRAVVANAAASTTNDSGNDTPVNVAAVQTQTPSVRRALSLLRGMNHGQTPGTSRALQLQRSSVQTQSGSRLRGFAKAPLTVTQSQTPSMVKGQAFFRTPTATITQAAAFVRSLGIARSSTQLQTPAARRGLSLLRAAVVAQFVVALRSFARTLTISQAQAPGEQHGAGAHYDKTISAQQLQAPSLSWFRRSRFTPAAAARTVTIPRPNRSVTIHRRQS